jgi:hypothetical protein
VNVIVQLEDLFGDKPASRLRSLAMPCELLLLLGRCIGAAAWLLCHGYQLSVKVAIWRLEWTPGALVLR